MKPMIRYFYDKQYSERFSGICTNLGIKHQIIEEEDLPDQVITEPITRDKRSMVNKAMLKEANAGN